MFCNALQSPCRSYENSEELEEMQKFFWLPDTTVSSA